MFKGTYSSSSSSDSSEDEAESLTLAQLSRKSPMVPHPRKLNEDTREDESDEALSSSSDNEQEKESKEDELKVPRALEEVLTEEAVPSELKDVWKGRKIKKFLDEDGLKKWTCAFCGEVRKGWNATKAMGHMLGGANNVKGCETRFPPNGSSCILI